MILASFISNAVDFFVIVGPFMFFLLALSVTALTVILLRGRALRTARVVPGEIAGAVEALNPGDDLDRLQRAIADHPSSLARILSTLIKHLNWPKAENLEAIQTHARNEVARLERGLVILEISTGIAPLLGLLGTLSGLVSIFATIGGSGDPVVIARGISEALNTTIIGLAIAVPSLVFYNYYQRKVEVMAIEMESISADLLAKCYPHGELPQVQKQLL